MNFALLSASFPSAKYEVKLEAPSKEELARQVAAFSHVISANIYNYGPVNYDKIASLVPKNATGLSALSQYTQGKLVELVKPAITLKLEAPTDESQVKKHKEKTRALEEIAGCAFIHALFTSVYSQKFAATGNPQKPEVRIASNLPEWQVVKKVDVGRQEPKEVFMTLANIYHSLHNKYPSFSQVTLSPAAQGRKSYSALLLAISALPSGSDFVAEWNAFEVLNACGFPPVPSVQTIGGLYPEIKIPKPRGNFGKKKK